MDQLAALKSSFFSQVDAERLRPRKGDGKGKGNVNKGREVRNQAWWDGKKGKHKGRDDKGKGKTWP